MYVVKEMYYYPDPDGNHDESLSIIAYTETKEDAETIKELRCKEIRETECHEPTGDGFGDGGCYLFNDMSSEELKKFYWDWETAYEVLIEKVEVVSAEEWKNKRV